MGRRAGVICDAVFREDIMRPGYRAVLADIERVVDFLDVLGTVWRYLRH